MDEKRHAATRERAHALWLAEGRPEGRALDHWLQAEAQWPGEVASLSVAGEEDPGAFVSDELPVPAAPTKPGPTRPTRR